LQQNVAMPPGRFAPYDSICIFPLVFSYIPPGFLDFVQDRAVLFQRLFFQTVNDFFCQFFDLQPEKWMIHGTPPFFAGDLK
jgi:hypothetical protein